MISKTIGLVGIMIINVHYFQTNPNVCSGNAQWSSQKSVVPKHLERWWHPHDIRYGSYIHDMDRAAQCDIQRLRWVQWVHAKLIVDHLPNDANPRGTPKYVGWHCEADVHDVGTTCSYMFLHKKKHREFRQQFPLAGPRNDPNWKAEYHRAINLTLW